MSPLRMKSSHHDRPQTQSVYLFFFNSMGFRDVLTVSGCRHSAPLKWLLSLLLFVNFGVDLMDLE